VHPDDPERLPTSVGGLCGTAAALYVRRFGLYGLLALAAFALQYAVDVALPHTLGVVQALEVIVDAFVVAAVAIGVDRDLRGERPDTKTVLAAASLRWGVVAIAGFIYFLAVYALVRNVFGSPEETGYGFFIPLIVTLWGAIYLAQVVAAIEPAASRLQLPLLAVGKALAVSLRGRNLFRLATFSALLVIPTVLQAVLAGELEHRTAQAAFWSEVPLDAITIGPLQALATIFYLDFVRRARGVRR
jgi:hypothetical protein